MYLLYNWQLIREENFGLTFTNRAFQYNDGLFDTLIMEQGTIRFLPDHLERMQQAMQVLQMDLPGILKNADALAEQIIQLANQNKLTGQLARVKIHIWRAPDGLFTPEQHSAECLITIQTHNKLSPIIPQADFATTVKNNFSILSFFKGPFAAKYVLASLEKKQRALDELILLDDKGYVSEALVANVFWIKHQVVYTPALETGCIAGIARKNVWRVAIKLGIQVQEGYYSAEDLLAAEVVFTSNVTGLRLIAAIGDKKFAPAHALVQELQAQLFPDRNLL